MKRLAAALIAATRPIVQRLARAYGLRVESSWQALGQHPLTFADPMDKVRERIPASVSFNTRSGCIVVGAECVFGEDVRVLTGMHLGMDAARAQGVELHHVPESGRDIVIGHGCYIGSGATLVGPLTLGDFAMVGAGSVVTSDVPAHGFVAGVPARLIKMLNANS